eukprot:COSAG01_NODE_67_length_29188_cov_1135.609474_14_plen_112_part_00
MSARRCFLCCWRVPACHLCWVGFASGVHASRPGLVGWQVALGALPQAQRPVPRLLDVEALRQPRQRECVLARDRPHFVSAVKLPISAAELGGANSADQTDCAAPGGVSDPY